MKKKKLFLASSEELKSDREQFEIFLSRKNQDWVNKGVFIDLAHWEDFLDKMSDTSLQNEYNKIIRECDIFVMLFFTKVGPYTLEEFETAFGQFKSTGKPFIFTYFKDAAFNTGSIDQKNFISLWAFQNRLKELGHFQSTYENIDDLKYKFSQQLDKLANSGFIELKFDNNEPPIINKEIDTIQSVHTVHKKSETKKFGLYIKIGLFFGLLALIFINQFKHSSNTSISNSSDVITVGPSKDSIVNISKGDLSTTASKRYNDALDLTQREIIDNFLKLGTLIKSVESYPPKPFWDKRRPNENELAFQARAKEFQNNYKNELIYINQKFPISTEIHNSYQRDLSYDPEVAEKLRSTYNYQKETPATINEFIEYLTQNLNFNIPETEFLNRVILKFNEKIISAKIAFCQAASQYILTTKKKPDIELLKNYLSLIGISLAQNEPTAVWQEINLIVGRLYESKVAILAKNLLNKNESEQREINRLVRDPYLIMLRKSMGLESNLSEADAWALKNKEINEKEDAPEKLLELAAFSYIESDGRASQFYLKKAMQNKDLSGLQKQFILKSLQRVENPDLYEGSIGIMIFDLTKEGTADKAGLRQGDIIFKINGELINEPLEISSLIAKIDKDNDVLFQIKRDDQTKMIAIKGGQSLNFKATQLIILNAIQL